MRTSKDLHFRFDDATAARLARLEKKFGLSRQGVIAMLIGQADAGESYASGQGSR